jgi:hypothetical protein
MRTSVDAWSPEIMANRDIMIDDGSFEIVQHFRYLGKMTTNENISLEELQRNPNSGSAWCSIQNNSSFLSLPKSVTIKPYKNIILPVVLNLR